VPAPERHYALRVDPFPEQGSKRCRRLVSVRRILRAAPSVCLSASWEACWELAEERKSLTGSYITSARAGQWVNEIEGGSEFGGVHGTKEEAVARARDRARQDGTEHVIHNQGGTISERSSYGKRSAVAAWIADNAVGMSAKGSDLLRFAPGAK
jgi:hypothetical protein